ncbi:sigma 54-interacting transcriptional regulator [Stieleria sp. TO1_6]|uniref:sigma 54-interacting transcriptional regulator n=1 Tax=Stieleria tagensis TaxID=2956795 RepID=UPI00209B5540|nr:sigma 54-interacting transcriptional regulator [Stieleria tagensis]MCO8121050.1 sigma 54-interacting transcriptional regulator [Stieleria tagensis]
MLAYLAVQTGPEQGRHFPLDPERPMHVGRGARCDILLSDPVCSRFHAVVFYDEGAWQVRDTGSRNGTLVNGQKIDTAQLVDQTLITIGGTEIRFVTPSTDGVEPESAFQTVIQDVSMATEAFAEDPMQEIAHAGYLVDLYLLSLSLLRLENPEDVIDSVLQLLRDRTSADAVGLSLDLGDGRQRPHKVIPQEHVDKVHVSKALLRRVVGEGEAIWVNDHRPGDLEVSDKLPAKSKWSDAIFVPLDTNETNLGILHLYRDRPSFNKFDFELAIAAARLLAVGLDRAMQHDSLRVEAQQIAKRNADTDELIGESPVMIKLKERIGRIAKANGSVLIRGESGCGKELVARAVHRHSARSKRPMLTVNCAAIPAELIESQLFGHKKGSFTGADKDHEGWFQQAHTGTLFLDEIGELTLEGQAKLLRILEGHPFLPVGGTQEVDVDVRVIAATNRDLAEFVRAKRFREDLFYRLSVFELFLPPLRERGDDLDLLIDHFLDHFRLQHGRAKLRLSDSARKRMHDYMWPGNVRQLRNVIDSAIVMADNEQIMPDDLGLRDAGVSQLDTFRIDEWEKRLISKALKRTKGSVPEAAKLLGISRATAYRKISEYEIDR